MEQQFFDIQNDVLKSPKCPASFARDDLRFSIPDVADGDNDSLNEFSFKSDEEFTNLTHYILMHAKEKRSEFKKQKELRKKNKKPIITKIDDRNIRNFIFSYQIYASSIELINSLQKIYEFYELSHYQVNSAPMRLK